MRADVKKKKKQAIIDLLPKKAYHIGKVCKAVGISRGTYYLWQEHDEEFAEKVKELFEYDIDDSEEKLRLLRHGLPKLSDEGKFLGWIERPHFGALVKHLEAKGRERGWGRYLDINGANEIFESEMSDEEKYKEIKKLDRLFKDLEDETDND